MKGTLFQEMDYGVLSFLWSYRNWSQQDFEGYYHFHRGFEVLAVHQGHGMVTVNQKTYELKPGMLFYFEPYQLHNVYVEVDESRPYERSVFHFDPVFMKGYLRTFPALYDVYKRMLQGLIVLQGIDMIDCNEELNAACSAFQNGLLASSASSNEEQSALYLLKVLSLIKRKVIPGPEQEEHMKPIRQSERVMAWIEDHYGEPFQLELLADELHMSKSYLSRLFRQETGSSITGYLTARRMQQACSLLQTTNKSIEVIGEQVGFTSTSYFISLFKRIMGVSPHQYRLRL
ncbi:helix-turn-helix domain-containing protein [Paenibacillus sp. 2TAB26]|uniref:helix-turn-helix domain-containing protein n=1 Tax=Paenibacillus sp. 2TAB26 TaxID=3233005 RepID=UPI003F94313D